MDNEKMTALLKMGYFPVTDDFWAAADMPHFIGEGFDWAFRMPLSKQRFMPYHEDTLVKRDLVENRMFAHRNLLET